MGKKNKKWVIVVVTEDGYPSVYGPYTKSDAETAEQAILMEDTSQKTQTDVQKLSKFLNEDVDTPSN